MARTPPSRTNSRSCSARRTLSSRAVLNEALVPIRLVDMRLCLSHRLANGFQQIGGIERLVEEIGGTALKRLLTNFLLVMRRNENHGQGRALEADAALQFDAVYRWHSNIGDQARRARHHAGVQKVVCRSKHQRRITGRFDEALERFSNSSVVVDAHDNRFHHWPGLMIGRRARTRYLYDHLCGCPCGRTPSVSAIRTSSASDRASIFRMI